MSLWLSLWLALGLPDDLVGTRHGEYQGTEGTKGLQMKCVDALSCVFGWPRRVHWSACLEADAELHVIPRRRFQKCVAVHFR
jgi:hypothetical protein